MWMSGHFVMTRLVQIDPFDEGMFVVWSEDAIQDRSDQLHFAYSSNALFTGTMLCHHPRLPFNLVFLVAPSGAHFLNTQFSHIPPIIKPPSILLVRSRANSWFQRKSKI